MGGMSLVFLLVTMVMGGFIAFYNCSWWTFAGASIGYLSYRFLEAFCLWTLSSLWSYKVSKKLRRFLFLRFKKTSFLLCRLFILEEDKKEEGYIATLRIVYLAIDLWKLLKAKYIGTIHSLLFSGVLHAPIFYTRWLVIGFFILEIRDSIYQNQITEELDFYLGVLVAITFLILSIKENEKENLAEIRIGVPLALAELLDAVHENAVNNSLEEDVELGRLRNEIRHKDWTIGQFVSDAWMVLVDIYGLIVVLAVLFVISMPGAMLASISLLIVLPALIFGVYVTESLSKPIVILRAKRRGLGRFLEDPRLRFLLHRVAPNDAVVRDIKVLGQEEKNVIRGGRKKNSFLRENARLVFFTLFALSALFPVLSIDPESMSMRVIILYAFSMMGLWYGVGSASQRFTRLYRGINDLEDVESAIPYLREMNARSSKPHARLPPGTEIKVEKFSFGYPGEPLIIKCPREFIIPSAVSTAQVVRVLGVHRQEMMRLLAGDISPTTGVISMMDHDVTMFRKEILICPDRIPNFDKGRIIDIFRAFMADGLEWTASKYDRGTKESRELRVVEEALREVELLDEIKISGREEYTGGNLILGRKKAFFTEDQNRRFYYALNLAVMRYRINEAKFTPRMIIVDGLHRVETLERRILIARLFKTVADSVSATLVLSALDAREIGTLDKDNEFVLRIVHTDLLPETLVTAGQEVALVTGGIHGDLLEHISVPIQTAYRDYLAHTKLHH